MNTHDPDHDTPATRATARDNANATAAITGAPSARRLRQQRPTPTVAELLEFEAANPRRGAATWEGRILARFDITPTRYLQLLNRALATVEALEVDPQLVRRLHEQRDRRATLRRADRLR